ncbi:MAG: DivIVA domain-containing protein [Actinomycetota bacterium]|nr:DivIVA domain-containing protein [Actinomycetota bacterium]
MVWFLGILVVLVLGAAVVVGTGRGGALRPAYDDRPDALVPAGSPLTGDDLRSVRFSVGLRGYRMDEVDALLARLADQLDDRDDARGDR